MRTNAGTAKMMNVSQIKLLIIDDDRDQRELTREVLEDRFGKGCVDEAPTGADALAKDLSSYDMILSDYNLPDCTGLDLLLLIRQRCRTPVIMVTGENVSEFAAEAIRRGATDYVVKVGDYFFTIPLVVEKNLTVAKLMHENERLHLQLRQSLDEVNTKNQQLNDALKRVEEVAATDALTGLCNRRHFSVMVEQLYAEAARYRTDVACVMIDLDGYKQLNDTLGHQMGDQILVEVGSIVRGSIRRSDVGARYGGDEFVLLLPHSDSQVAVKLATRIRDEFKVRSAHATNGRCTLSMSIGISSMLSNQPASADELVGFADAALFVSKQAGRDRITISAEHKVRAAG
jgi:two-component system, cell cycle response regulator